jgi:hypothetical protein
MPIYEVKINLGAEEYAFVKFQAVKLNMTIPSILKKLIKEAREKEQKNTASETSEYSL